ncbi:phosphoenolpyruvate--protein phosphotransferase [Marinobacterium jannaschii]|uniref:phosphoenolpyruvate--protein phosphotransferase n=1 Tax=Marinobacterium jannaschii TaxID=64970 RepID=UPI000486470F|nr:phosphoenolpyruvate--protein phosphotransferase [Marinobacterium jannaschii]
MLHSLATLTSLVQEISRAPNAVEAMQTIVVRLGNLFNVPVCSLYLRSEADDQLVLAASAGLAEASVGQVSLCLKEGLVGTIAHSTHPLNIADAPTHDKFVYIPETHEEPYHQFLGVPLIHLRNLVGVLVIQGTDNQPFAQDVEAFMVTVAAQLAATLRNIQRSEDWRPQSIQPQYRKHQGIKSSTGIGCGYLKLVGSQVSLDRVKPGPWKKKSAECEIEHFHNAVDQLRNDLSVGASRLSGDGNSEVSSLFSVYSMMLDSPELIHSVEQHIKEGCHAAWALKETALSLSAVFEAADDPYMRARSEDILNIASKLLRLMQAKPDIDESHHEEIILAGALISITDLSAYPAGTVKGIICTGGSSLSHTAIVANALGIPSVMGVSDLKLADYDGEFVIVDGYRGECITWPSEALIEEFRRIQAADTDFSQELMALRDSPAETCDGYRVRLLANTGLLADVTPGLRNGAEGVGLYRSEIPFMVHDNFPTEEEQYQVYRQVLGAYAPMPVSMRTLDIGGDKELPYFEIKEDNPYLGWRGIRFMLDNTALLVTQLRAMMRASEGSDNLQLMIPMVGRIDELEAFHRIADSTWEELLAEGYEIKRPQIGMMVEVPSTILLLPKMAQYVDFVSIGSNDLTQYLLAVDRNNPRVSPLFDNLNPAMLSALELILQHCRDANLPVSLCGEMASDPAAVILLLGMGFDTLSLSAYNIPKIKWLIRCVSRELAQKLYRDASMMSSEADIRALLREELCKLGLDKLTGPTNSH